MFFEIGTLRQLGVVMKDTSGLRKMRWATNSKGKRGGARVIYYYGDHMPIFMVAIFSKSEKVDMTGPEKKPGERLR